MINLSTILKYYKRRDVQEAILANASDREVAVSFGGKSFGKRPDVLQHPGDVLELVKQGATSFHASEELWRNPLQLSVEMRSRELNELRKGWDLIIDIDCPYFEYSKIAADLIVKALKHHNIKSVSVKFSGNKGFHIGIPFESFPNSVAGEVTSNKFPDVTKSVAFYLKEMVQKLFLIKIGEMENGNVEKIAKNLDKRKEDITIGSVVKELDMLKILDMDTLLISSRHLYRMPYSLHEKSGLVSIPIDPEKILEFNKDCATPSKIKVRSDFIFLDKKNVISNEAKGLFDKATAEAMAKKKVAEYKFEGRKQIDIPETAIPEQFFPPCIKLILQGLEDGRKRSVFVLINFLISVGWDYDKIEVLLNEWNKKNKPPLKYGYIISQFKYSKIRKKRIPPPNCLSSNYYQGIGVCKKDNLCEKIKNPVSYSSRKIRYIKQK